MVTYETTSADATEELASQLASHLVGGEVLLLIGELGAGKTCFVRGLARGLEIPPRQVKSPSYNILHQYDGGRLMLQHFDAYFVREAEEFHRDGIDEFIRDRQVVAVEWANRFELEFPDDSFRITFETTGEESRRITFDREPHPEWLRQLQPQGRAEPA